MPGALSLAFKAQRLWDIDNDIIQASELFEEALSNEGEHQNAWLHALYAQFLEKAKNDFSGASSHYQISLKIDPEQPLALGNYAMHLHKNEKNIEPSFLLYEKNLLLYKSHVTVSSKYANLIKLKKRDYVKAEKIYKGAINENPRHGDCLGSYAILKHGIQDSKDMAENLYRKSIEADSLQVNNLSNFALFCSEVNGKHEIAEKLYLRALAIDPKHANSLYNYGVLQDSAFKNLTKAEELYRRAIESNPSHSYAWYNLAVLLEEIQGREDAAEDAFLNALSSSPNDPVTLSDFGNFLMKVRKNMSAAETYFRKSLLASNSTYSPAWCRLGDVLNARGSIDEATAAYSETLKFDNQNADALWKLARIYHSLNKDVEKANNFYEKAIKLKPDQPELLIDYADFLADKKQSHSSNKTEARSLYEQAKTLAPTNALILYNYAVFLIEERDYEKALKLLEKAHALTKYNDPDCSTQYALLLWQFKKNTVDAKIILGKIIQRHRDYEPAKLHYNKLKLGTNN